LRPTRFHLGLWAMLNKTRSGLVAGGFCAVAVLVVLDAGELDPEQVLRLSCFMAVLVLLGVWEWGRPRRKNSARMLRWPSNFGILLSNVVVLSLLPLTAVTSAYFALEHRFGLFVWLEMPLWLSVILSLLVLDAVIYWQHRLFHLITPMWRVHRMHHTDLEFDVTTALRFHPVEIVVSLLIKAAVIILLGAPVLSVIAFEIILNGSAMFNHSNIRLPRHVDRCLRSVVVTPDMHRVHHSVHGSEHQFNFGFCLSVWDKMFGSYVGQPRAGHEQMEIGLNDFRGPEEGRLDKLLTQPFR